MPVVKVKVDGNWELASGGGGGGGSGTVTSVQVQATSPVQSSTSTAQTSTLNTTISLADAYGDTKNPYGSKTKNYVLAAPSSAAGNPSFRALVAGDIPDLSGTYATKATTLSGYGITDAKIANGVITLGSNTITPLTSETYTGTVTSVRVQATSPVNSSTSAAQSTTLNTTISLADAYGDTKNPYGTKTKNYVLAGPTTGSNAAPTFRALVAADIPDLSSVYLPLSTPTPYPIFFSYNNNTLICDKTFQEISTAISNGKVIEATYDNGDGIVSSLNYSFGYDNGTISSIQFDGIYSDGGDTGYYVRFYYDSNRCLSIQTLNGVVEGLQAKRAYADDSGNRISATYAAKATTLSGYGITDAKISNGTITLGSNSITPLTSETYTGTVTSVQVAATSPVQSSTATASSTTLSTTISLADAYGDTKNPYGTKTANYVLAGPSSGSAAAPSFRALTTTDIPDLSSTYLPLSAGSSYPLTDDLYIAGSSGSKKLLFTDNGDKCMHFYYGSDGTFRCGTCNSTESSLIGMSSNTSGDLLLYANEQNIRLRPNGISSSTNQVTINTDGQQIGGHPMDTATALTADKSITASTVTPLMGFTDSVSNGIYLYTVHIQFTPSAATAGFWYVGIHSSNNTTAPSIRQSQWTANTTRKDMTFTCVTTGNTTVYAKIYSTVAGTVSASNSDFRRVRLS